MKETTADISTLIQDDLNFNKGTAQGEKMLDYSIKAFGVGKGVLVDENYRIVAGNKTVQAAIKAGIKKIRIVETDGTELVAVKRTDVDLDTKKGREFALADNVVGNVNFDIDYSKVNKAMERVEMHPEIWDVEMPKEKTLARWEKDPFKGAARLNTFSFNVYSIIMSEEESEALQKKAKAYNKEHGTMDGFIGQLIKEYNERNK